MQTTSNTAVKPTFADLVIMSISPRSHSERIPIGTRQ
jgi:hypothetical protein